jgi:hypothetical protein
MSNRFLLLFERFQSMRITPIGRILLFIAVLALPTALSAQALSVRVENGQIRFAARQLRLLTGDPLLRLKDGASVVYLFKVSIGGERRGAPIAQETYRFVVTYDLWEEKFSVTEIEPARRSVSRLSDSAAQTWCTDAIAISVAGIAADRQLWALVEYDTQELGSDSTRGSGSPLGSLIDIFGGKKNPKQPVRGSLELGPFRLSDLR